MSAIPRPGMWRSVAVLAALALGVQFARAQGVQNGAAPNQQPLNAIGNGVGFGNGIGIGNGVGNGNGVGPGGRGGAASADFDSLIDLIIGTVEAESWQENGTGEGEIMPFPTGVYVDAAGALSFTGGQRASLASVRAGGLRAASSKQTRLSARGGEYADPSHSGAGDSRAASSLRYVSLSRLEAAIADRQRQHLPLEPEMLTLAGLQRVAYVLVYPETGDLVLAGPAGDWQKGASGAIVAADTGRPVVRLDDLLALWRRQRAEKSATFGCSIVPRQEALARTQEFLTASAAQPLEPGGRRKWLAELRDTLGVQDVAYAKIDPDTRIGRLLLAADYHMKLVGMGLAEGVPGVKSYLASVRLQGGVAPAMTVLRWWFAMPEAKVAAAADRDAFSLPERCVVVLSENELLAARGQRVHTGESEDLNREFAESFTAEYAALAAKYPVYGELERVFELALALALIEREGLAEKAGWAPSLLLDGERLRLPRIAAPRTVETVINHRVIAGRHIIAGVSGGVWLDGGKSLAVAPAAGATVTTLASVKRPVAGQAAAAADAAKISWWWD